MSSITSKDNQKIAKFYTVIPKEIIQLNRGALLRAHPSNFQILAKTYVNIENYREGYERML